MKPILKILIPVFFITSIGVFVAFKSGAFDSEKSPVKEHKAPKAEQKEVTKTDEPVQAASPEKETEPQSEALVPKKVPVRGHSKTEDPETTQNVNVAPVVMPSSKSVIMTNPTIDKKSIFNKYSVSPKPAPKKQRVMPSSKSGVMINP